MTLITHLASRCLQQLLQEKKADPMTSAQPNAFQTALQRDIVNLLTSSNVKHNVRDERLGDEFTYIVSFHGLDIWIYTDGCNLHRAKIDKRLEIYDFSNLDSLAAAALKQIRTISSNE